MRFDQLTTAVPESFDENNTLLIDVNPYSVNTQPVADIAASFGLEAKAEYHLTVVGSRDVTASVTEMITLLSANEQAAFKASLNSLIPLLGNSCLKANRYHHLIKRYEGDEPEIRESIIQEAAVEGIDNFYDEFSQLTGIELGTPFPHLTLFTGGNGPKRTRGIGVLSREAFQTMEHRAIIL